MVKAARGEAEEDTVGVEVATVAAEWVRVIPMVVVVDMHMDVDADEAMRIAAVADVGAPMVMATAKDEDIQTFVTWMKRRRMVNCR